ncbi:MAG: methyltransferase domain-containing protein [Pseudomonadota bacterium]
MSVQSQYSDRVIAGMQMVYGKGFLSPGAAPEVTEILEGIDITGLDVLDLGCGIGGAALMLAGEFGAKHVTGVDIEADSVKRATAAAEEAGLGGRVRFVHTAPGPLPVPDGAVDIVFTKDVICHVADKPALFADVFRVLKPGGRFLCADFLDGEADGEAAVLFVAWVDMLKTFGLSFHYEGRPAYEAALADAGFVDVAIRDHTANSAGVARREHAFATSDDGRHVREVLGEDYFDVRIRLSSLRAEALEARGVLHLHIDARRP